MSQGDEPAFPHWNQTGVSGAAFPAGSGISVRELFTLGAMMGILSHDGRIDRARVAEGVNVEVYYREIVNDARGIADEMLKQLRQV
jgi:hypothetical protein